MISQRFFLTVLAASALAVPAYAQFDSFDSTPPLPAWEQFKLSPKTRILLDFRNASPGAVVDRLSKASGIPIITDPNLVAGITLQSPAPVPLNTAFALLNASLNLRDYEIQRQDGFLVIKPRARGFGGGGNGRNGGFPGGFGGGSSGSRTIILKVYSIKYANATQVARMINEVFTGLATMDTQSAPTPGAAPQPDATPQPGTTRGRRGRGSAGLDDGTDDEGSRVVPAAGQFPGGFGGGGFGGGQRFGGGGGFPNFGAGGRQNNNNNTTSLVKASADDFSNSVIVNAPAREQDQIARILEQVDKRTDQPQQSKVFVLKYARAADLATIVQNVLVSNAPRGRGGIGTQNVPVNQLFQQAARLGSAQASFGTVAPDVRTNSLVVTATDENLLTVGAVIDQLDKPTTYASTTFVFPLKNARADVVAQLLNSSFSSKNGTANNFSNLLGGTVTQTTNQQRTIGSNSSNSGGPPQLGRGVRTGRGVSPETGSSAGTTRAAEPGRAAEPDPQFFGGGGGGGGFGGGQVRPGGTTGTSTQSAQTSVDANGQIVNLHDPSGLNAVPDVNTNSVIIVSTPDNKELIEKIVAQLDQIPQQVMIETLVVEASLDATTQFGVEWNFTTGQSAFTSAFGLQANATTQPQGLEYTLTNKQYGVFLQAVKTDTRFDVLSTPRIFTSNNATAEINISQSLPYVTSQTVDTNGAFFYNYSFLDVGIILTVTPRITGNGYVTMDVDQTANDFVNYTSFNAPVVNQREAQTTVSVKDGETIVLGGIIQSQNTKTVNKIPILGDLPLVGSLFRSTNKNTTKTELLIFLTPHIIRDADEARKLREQTEKSMQPTTQQTLKEFRKMDTTVNPNVPDVNGKVDGVQKGTTPAGQTTPPSSQTKPPSPTTPPSSQTTPVPTKPTTP